MSSVLELLLRFSMQFRAIFCFFFNSIFLIFIFFVKMKKFLMLESAPLLKTQSPKTHGNYPRSNFRQYFSFFSMQFRAIFCFFSMQFFHFYIFFEEKCPTLRIKLVACESLAGKQSRKKNGRNACRGKSGGKRVLSLTEYFLNLSIIYLSENLT